MPWAALREQPQELRGCSLLLAPRCLGSLATTGSACWSGLRFAAMNERAADLNPLRASPCVKQRDLRPVPPQPPPRIQKQHLLKEKKPNQSCFSKGGVDGLRSVWQTRGCSSQLGKAGRRESFRTALLAPRGSPSSPALAARHGSQQLLLTGADGHGPLDAFSYGPCLPPARPFPPRSQRLTWDGSRATVCTRAG